MDIPFRRELNDAETTSAWHTAQHRLGFDHLRPSSVKSAPSVTWSLASLTTPDGFPDEDRVDALCRVVSDALRACTPQGTDLLLLDWQHLCYSVDPHRAAASVWSNAFIPDPDPAFVIAPDFSYGVFGQASDDTLLVFGQALVDRTMPQLNPVLGEPVGKDA